MVVGIFINLTCIEFGFLFVPSGKHTDNLCGILAFVGINFKAEFPIGFADGNAINIFKRKESVSQTYVTVNIGHVQCFGCNIQSIDSALPSDDAAVPMDEHTVIF